MVVGRSCTFSQELRCLAICNRCTILGCTFHSLRTPKFSLAFEIVISPLLSGCDSIIQRYVNRLRLLFAHGCITSMSLGGSRMALDHSLTHSILINYSGPAGGPES